MFDDNGCSLGETAMIDHHKIRIYVSNLYFTIVISRFIY